MPIWTRFTSALYFYINISMHVALGWVSNIFLFSLYKMRKFRREKGKIKLFKLEKQTHIESLYRLYRKSINKKREFN